MSTERQYIQGFNNGYILAKFEPDLLNTVSQSIAPINSHLEGLFNGKEQFEFENSRNRLFELQELRHKSQNREKGFEK